MSEHIIRAPWTEEQVQHINNYQNSNAFHPFTCGGDHHYGSPMLVAGKNGWSCPVETCPYQQDWAYDFMAHFKKE